MATFARTQEVEHEIGSDGSFSLRVTSAEVELRATRSTVASVRATFELRAGSEAEADDLFERLQLRVHRGAGTLDIREPKQSIGGGIGTLARIFAGGGAVDLQVVAEIPVGSRLRFDGVSAELTVAGLGGLQEYRTVSGDLVLNDVGGEIRLHGVSGDVSLRADRDLSLEAATVSGDLSAIAPRFSLARVNSVSGDVELDGALQPDGSHRVETVSGDLSLGLAGDLSLEVRGLSTDVDILLDHRAEGSRDRRRYIIGAGGPTLGFHSMSGDVSVRPARRAPPDAPLPTTPPAPPAPPAAGIDAEAQLEILRAVERGEIGIDEASRRLSGEPHA